MERRGDLPLHIQFIGGLFKTADQYHAAVHRQHPVNGWQLFTGFVYSNFVILVHEGHLERLTLHPGSWEQRKDENRVPDNPKQFAGACGYPIVQLRLAAPG